MEQSNLMNKIVSLCKRRGFVFQSSEIYGGLKSSYDYGPLGTELKRNLANKWWRNMVYERENIYGIDASIIMHTDVWKASGHLKNFTDPLVDCYDCRFRFRPDKVEKVAPGTEVEYRSPKDKKKTLKGNVGDCGYVCPECGSVNLSDARLFRGMFQTTLGPVDHMQEFVEKNYDKNLSKEEFIQELQKSIAKSSVYLRPETAQAMFVQFNNVLQTTSAKVPFGIAQLGKSFRNEIVVEHFIFRSCEFEQMEMEFFCEPGTHTEWLDYWTKERLEWYQKFTNSPENFRLRQHESDERAHYSDDCYDVEYKFPWGWDELEGIASRTDYDLKKHSEASKTKLSYFDPNKEDPKTGKKGWRFTPYVVEPAAGLTRLLLAVLCDAYREDTQKDAKGNEKTRVFLKLSPQISPIKVAILPLLRKEGHPQKAKEIAAAFRKKGIHVSYDDVSSIGKRYAKHDEIGTPWCLTVDAETMDKGLVTLRDRDTTEQEQLSIEDAVAAVVKKLQV